MGCFILQGMLREWRKQVRFSGRGRPRTLQLSPGRCWLLMVGYIQGLLTMVNHANIVAELAVAMELPWYLRSLKPRSRSENSLDCFEISYRLQTPFFWMAAAYHICTQRTCTEPATCSRSGL